MVGRNRPLPPAPPPRVDDGKLQRAFEALFVPLREVIRFLRPFVQPEKWQVVTYVPGWIDLPGTYGRSSFKKDPLGRVLLRGIAQRTSGVATQICVLPEGYRPSFTQIFIASSNSVDCRLDIGPEGIVTLAAGGLATNYVSLNGISFDTED